MPTRRGFLRNGFGVSATVLLGSAAGQAVWAQQPDSDSDSDSDSDAAARRWEPPSVLRVADAELELNKSVVRRLKESQGTADAEALAQALQAPDYRRLRGGFAHLAANAADQGFPDAGLNLRTAIPDRVDVIEDIVADGDQVGMLFRITGTHRGNLFGIDPTDRPIDVYEAGIYRLREGRVTEAWFMADEAGLLKQLGAKLPPRTDGRLVAPPVTGGGEDGDTVLARLAALGATTQTERNKILVARSKSSMPDENARAPDYAQRRQGFQYLRDYGNAHGVGEQTPTRALPNRHDRIDELLAESDTVWMRFRLAGTNTRPLYGLPPSNAPVEVPELGIMRFANGKWIEGWYFGDELGLLLQIGQPDALFEG
jgi:predicted ester cyclase